jgi:hypothetical protein
MPGPKPPPLYAILLADGTWYQPVGLPALSADPDLRDTIWLTVDGVTKSLAEWAEIRSIDRGTMHTRYTLGWSPDRIVNTPIGPQGRKKR